MANWRNIWAYSKSGKTFDEVSCIFKILQPVSCLDSEALAPNSYSLQLSLQSTSGRFFQNVVEVVGAGARVWTIQVSGIDGIINGRIKGAQLYQRIPDTPGVDFVTQGLIWLAFTTNPDGTVLAGLSIGSDEKHLTRIENHAPAQLVADSSWFDATAQVVGAGGGSRARFTAGQFDIGLYLGSEGPNAPPPISDLTIDGIDWSNNKPAIPIINGRAGEYAEESSNLYYDVLEQGPSSLKMRTRLA